MRYFCILTIALASLAAASFAETTVPESLPSLETIRVDQAETVTRVLIDVSGPAKFHFFPLKEPDRLVVDLQIVEPTQSPPLPPGGDTAITGIRLGIQPDGRVRYVFDLNTGVKARVYEAQKGDEPGSQIVVEINHPGPAAVSALPVNTAAQEAPAQPKSDPAVAKAAAATEVSRSGSSDEAVPTSTDDLFGYNNEEVHSVELEPVASMTALSVVDGGDSATVEQAPASADDLFGFSDDEAETVETTPASADDLFGFTGEESVAEEQAPTSADDLFGFSEEEAGSDGQDPAAADDLFGFEEETADSQTGKTGPEVQGFVQFGSAYTYSSPTHLSLARSILELGSDGRFSEAVSWKLSGRAAYDAVFELDNFYSSRVRDNREFDAQVYETYLDISAGDLEFRLGRQHIIWGEMVGLFFADVVSAKDTRQFVAQDFDLIRIPQWAGRAEYFHKDYHAEAIWIPFMTYNEIGKPGDDFYPLGTELPKNPNVVIRNDEQPTRDPSNSAYGIRLSALAQGWDISGFYYGSVDIEPTFFSEVEQGPNPRLIITPEHKRIHQFGSTLAKDFGQVVLKSELIFTMDRYFAVEDPAETDGVRRQDILDYVVGLEHTTPGNTLLNFQIYQRWNSDHYSGNIYDEFETGVSFFGKFEVNNKLDAELLLISQLNRSDWMVRPRVAWLFSRNWLMQFGVDIFGGQDIGLFGRFDNSDRVYANVRYTF